jgi:hypothetical protein
MIETPMVPTPTFVERILESVPMKPIRCPCCRLRNDGRHIWAYRNCAACGAQFRIRRLYFLSTYTLAVAFSFALAFAVGNRGAAFSSLAMLLVLPTFWVMLVANLWLFPTDVELIREGWTPGESEADRELEREFESLRALDPVLRRGELETPALGPVESADEAPGRLPLSTPREPPVTLEGIAIVVAVTALLAYHVYTAIEPFL